MIRNEQAGRASDLADRPLRHLMDHPREHSEPRTIVIRHGSGWQSLAFLCLCLLFLGVIMMGHEALRGQDRQNQDTAVAMARFERKVQQLESGIAFDSKRRYLLLGMRDHILKVNPRVSLGDAYRYAQLALEASEKYPAVEPLLLLAIGTVESGYDPEARSRSDARGLYQIWPSTGRLLLRSREEHPGGRPVSRHPLLHLQRSADGARRVQRRAPERGLLPSGSGPARRGDPKLRAARAPALRAAQGGVRPGHGAAGRVDASRRPARGQDAR